MKIRHLRIFKMVCETESITKAAENLFISQPAVSNAIRELEEHLGLCLFDRLSRRIYLNETGKLFLKRVRKLLDLYDDLERNVGNLGDKAGIKIGSSITIANFILPKAIVNFQEVYRDTPIKVTVANARKIEKMLVNNEIDLGLIEGIVYNEELVDIPFSSYKLAIICSPKHKFALEHSVDIHKLMQEKLLLREKGSAIRDVFDSALMLHNLRANPEWVSINSQSLIYAVRENLGLSVLPWILVSKEINKGEIVEIKVNDLELVNENHIIFHKDKVQTKSFKALLKAINPA